MMQGNFAELIEELRGITINIPLGWIAFVIISIILLAWLAFGDWGGVPFSLNTLMGGRV
jgi:hypothetical protein